MRLLYFALLIITNTVFAQDYVKLSGKILNPVSDSILIRYNDNFIAYSPKDFFAHIDKNGNFSLTFPVPHGIYTQATIIHGNKLAEIILQPGDSLVLSANASRFDSSIHYTGKGSEIQNFLAQHSIEKGSMNQYTLKIRTHINKEPADFIKSIEQEEKIENEFLEKHNVGIPKSFISYWTAYFQYYNYFFIQQYPQTHAIIKTRKYTDTIPEINFSVVKQMPYAFYDSLLQLPPYLLYLTGVFDIKLKAAGYTYYTNDTMGARKFQDSVTKLVYKLLPDKSAAYYMAQNLYGRARNQSVEKTEYMFSEFKKHWLHSEYLPILEKQVAIAEKLAPGQPAPDFDIKTPDGRNMKLSDLKGKVVYLGFWANWCKQCVGEIIRESKIKELTKNKPLEFVYVSIDNDTTKDNAIISKYKIEGIFHHADGEWKAKEIALYGVQSLPAYYLIDEDGKFAMQNPPSSSQSTELILAIEKLFR